jgi:hypothetical protein
MRRAWLLALLIVAASAGGAPTAALAQALPKCPDDDESVINEVPRLSPFGLVPGVHHFSR